MYVVFTDYVIKKLKNIFFFKFYIWKIFYKFVELLFIGVICFRDLKICIVILCVCG